MSDSDTSLSSDTSNENSDGTGVNESDEMSEEMEVFVGAIVVELVKRKTSECVYNK